MTIEEMKKRLKKMLKHDRYVHSLGVMDTMLKYAEIHGVDRQRAEIAGLLHDCAKNISKAEMFELCDAHGIVLDHVCRSEPGLIHAFLGVVIARREFRVFDVEILAAIYYHTIGAEDMTKLMKILYLADMCEPGRKFPDLNVLRELAEKDLNAAMIKAFNMSIIHVIGKGRQIHPETVYARNFLISRKGNHEI